MKKLSPSVIGFIVALVVISCSTKKSQQDDSKNDTTNTTSTLTEHKPVSPEPTEVNDTCIFNNDYKKLTMDWVEKLGASGFEWNSELYSAIKITGEDTIRLSQGGCYHFGISTEWSLVDTHPASDSAYWIDKALKFAKEYKFSDYEEFISARRLVRRPDSQSIVLYDVIDTASVTNRIFEGISISERGERKTLGLSMYFN